MDRVPFREIFHRLFLNLAGLMSAGTDHGTMGSSREHRILVIGKSGNGKSTLCNTITGSQRFVTGRGMTATTRTVEFHDVTRYGYHIRMVDTPDVTNCNMGTREMQEEVFRWRRFTEPYPTAVLLTVRCDIRYTAEEHAIYREIQRLWGDNSLTERLVVAFTFGDRQDVPLEEELPGVCPELKGVLRQASHRYVLFDNRAPTDEKEVQVQQLLNMIDATSMKVRQTPKYLIPALLILAIVSGFGFASSITTANTGLAIGSGLLFLASGLGVVLLKIKEKMH